MSELSERRLGFETQALHAGQPIESDTLSRAVPVYRTTSYVFKSTEHAANLFALKELGNIYTRLMNPTHDVLEKRIAALEGGAAGLALSPRARRRSSTRSSTSRRPGTRSSRRTTSTAAPTRCSTTSCRSSGSPCDSSTRAQPENFEKAITPRTRAVFAETIGNPALDVLDLEAVADVAHRHRLPLIVDCDLHDALPAPPDRARRGHRGPLADQVDRRPRHGHRRAQSSTRAGSTGPTPSSALQRARAELPRPALRARPRTDEPAGLHPAHAARAAAQPRRLHLARQRLDVPPGHRDAAAAHGASLRRTPCGGQASSRAHPKVAWVRYPGLPDDPDARGRHAVPREGLRRHGRLRRQGRPRRRAAVHREPPALLAPRQRRRRQEPGHPSGDDDALAAHRGGAARGRASRPTSCASRSASSTSTTSSPTSTQALAKA